MQHSEIILVGGSGKTGRRIAERLSGRGIKMRFVSRSSDRLFDWNNRQTWADALAGARSAYVTFQPDLAVEWAPDAIAAFAKTAHECRLRHVLLLSGRGEVGAVRSEEALQASGVGYMILRASWFCQNFSEGAFAGSIATGELALPAGDVREPFIDADDIADAAVAALTDQRHLGKTYELTGPRALTFREAVAEIARLSARVIGYRQISMTDFKTGLSSMGLPEATIALLEELFSQVLDGRNSNVMNGVFEILGRAPRDFGAYVCDAAAAGAWGA
jgi:uncharacterized protein YbjT (DUF2867 family)